MKMGIELTHVPKIYFDRKMIPGEDGVREAIASHDFGDPDEMKLLWQNYEEPLIEKTSKTKSATNS